MSNLIMINNNETKSWYLDDKEFMCLKKDKFLTISWDGNKLNLNKKIKLVTDEFELKDRNLVEKILKKQTLEKIKESVDKRFKSSYKDIVLKVVTYFSVNQYIPVYTGYNDYDSYNDALRACIEREIYKIKRVYGG